MGDNIEIFSFRTLPYNALPLISLYHGLDPNHSIVSKLLCITNWNYISSNHFDTKKTLKVLKFSPLYDLKHLH